MNNEDYIKFVKCMVLGFDIIWYIYGIVVDVIC